MSEEKENKNPVVLKIVDYIKPPENNPDLYEPSAPDLREISDRVYSVEGVKEKFIEMYSSFEDLHDCSITDRGFNLYTEDEEFLYVYTVIKKEENE